MESKRNLHGISISLISIESEISRVSEWNKEPSLKANNQQEIGQELISQQIQASMTHTVILEDFNIKE